ncbi:MAG: outer membrane lipoprotein carrier protein LolA [Pseudomonadales bacterium]|nr:outer membrane lipoprotein carrier protein LolA [Pseudomonadales bacterium]
MNKVRGNFAAITFLLLLPLATSASNHGNSSDGMDVSDDIHLSSSASKGQPAYSKESNSAESNSSVSKDVPVDSLEGLAQQLSGITLLSSPFKQYRYLSILSKPLVSEGGFQYRKDHNICWQVEKPVPAIVELTAESVRMSDASGVQSFDNSNPVLSHLSTLFFAIFSGQFKQLESQFAIEWTNSDSGWVASLVPMEKSLSNFVQRFVIKGRLHIAEVEMYQKSGDKTLLVFGAPLINEMAKDIPLECESGQG